MKRPGDQRAAVLLLRAWMEDRGVLRVRIIGAVGWDEPRTVVLTSVDEVVTVVRAWLEELLEASGAPDPNAGLPPM